MCSNSKDIYGVSLIIEREDCVFVDIIGSHDSQGGEPIDVERLGDADERLAGNLGQVSLK